jgi:hypothetical protein
MGTLEAIQVKMTLEAHRLVVRLGPEAVVLVELRYRPAACDSSFCKPIPYVSTRTSGQPPERGFVRMLSSGTPVFLQEPLAELAAGGKIQVTVDTTGFWKWRRLRTTGLDSYLI